MPLNDFVHRFAREERVGYIDGHYAESSAHGYCANGRWIWQRNESGDEQEEVRQLRKAWGAVKVFISPGTLHPNGGGTDAIERAISAQLRPDLTRRFPTFGRQYP